MMESERGVDVKFITPTPGYVIKTVQNGDTKCFVNICFSNTIDKATCTPSAAKKGSTNLSFCVVTCRVVCHGQLCLKENIGLYRTAQPQAGKTWTKPGVNVWFMTVSSMRRLTIEVKGMLGSKN